MPAKRRAAINHRLVRGAKQARVVTPPPREVNGITIEPSATADGGVNPPFQIEAHSDVSLPNTSANENRPSGESLVFNSEFIDAHVKQQTREKVWRGEYVDIGTLLPNDAGTEDSEALTMVTDTAVSAAKQLTGRRPAFEDRGSHDPPSQSIAQAHALMAQAHALMAQGSQPEELEDKLWVDNSHLQLYTDAAGSIGFGAYLQGRWFCGRWPDHWVKDGTTLDMTFLELFPIVCAIQLWGTQLMNKKILFYCDNQAVVAIINKQSTKAPRSRCTLEVSVQSFPGSSTGSRTCANAGSRQHMAHLKQEVDRLLLQSLSENTWSTYRTGINALKQFRSVHQLPETWPVPLDQVVNFIAHLSVTNHSPNTVKTYIAGISANHKFKGMEDCTNHFLVTKLITGMYKSRGRQDTRKPITLDLLKVVINNLTQVCSSSYEVCLFRAVYCIAFFGFFRVSELVQTKMSQPGCSINNVSISGEPEKATIHLPHSKGDQHGYGNSVGIEPTPGKSPCPVAALKAYLKVRPSGPAQAFIHFDHSPLTRYQFQAVLKKALALSSIGTESYSSHSFRIGAATTAAINGVPPHLIQQYGRWKSECYQSYIRLPVT
ncbi:uncharacterized protein [Haliotis cracherodii]|uniref:uncharacterized protein n=1 Tax=Haliotis cracherodii TaxID=6455 RepID=UPI0039E809F2